MAKRVGDSDNDNPRRKRQKCTKDFESEHDIKCLQAPEDLSSILSFEQDAGPGTFKRIQLFKLFLNSIVYSQESDDRATKRSLLLKYLRSQASSDHEGNFTYLADIVKTWHFAAQIDAEALFSLIANVLALLLRTISSLIEFQQWGNHLCSTLLHIDQIKLLDRGLSANKIKEHLIAPCLRLLTEIVSFDGGRAARSLFRQREITFKRLDVFLRLRKNARKGESQSRRMLSLREYALQYLHANIRLQNATGKMYILAQGSIVHSWLEDISEDPPNLILEVLEMLKRDIAMDSAMSFSVKRRFFNEWVLGRLATLYSYKESGGPSESHRSVQESIHNFLLLICTSPGHGVFDAQDETQSYINDDFASDKSALGKQTVSTQNRSYGSEQATLRNKKLSSFLQILRPHANLAHSDLVIAVFRKTPELIADYFSRRKSFIFDPKATATWVGYSAFILATVQIPFLESLQPTGVGDHIPPSYDDIIESIIPCPLTKKVMTRCLNQSSNLVKFLTIRILNAAIGKFDKVLNICKERQECADDKHYRGWSQMISRLAVGFYDRIPDMEHIISQFRGCSKVNSMLLESFTRLLSLYYEVVPEAALAQKFDISMVLAAALEMQNSHPGSAEDHGMKRLELGHLLVIAHLSPDMQWFHKPDLARVSPFTKLLMTHRDRSQAETDFQDYSEVIGSVAIENNVLNSHHSLETLNLSLQNFGDWKASIDVFEFLDNCILRLVRRPVHYFDLLGSLALHIKNVVSISEYKIDLLLMAVNEQWPFLAKNVSLTSLQGVSLWLARYMEICVLRSSCTGNETYDNGKKKILSQVRDQIRASIEDKPRRRVIEAGWKYALEHSVYEQTVQSATASVEVQITEPDTRIEKEVQKAPTSQVPPGPPPEDEDHPCLTKWSCEDIEDAISDGVVGGLFRCLCSEYPAIRKQAMGNVKTFMMKLEKSGYDEWLQIFVLTGEMAETARDVVADTPLSHFTGALISHLLQVVAEPLHFMYVKANKFLNEGPRWNLKRLPSYWVDKVLLSPPTEDGAHYLEVAWFLDILIDGLRTPVEMELYRHCNIFERLLSLAGSPSLPEPCSKMILSLLFRCTYVDGSTTLITRCAVISWISSRLNYTGITEDEEATLRSLARRLYDTCDQTYVGAWSNGTLAFTLDRLRLAIDNP